MSFKIYLTINKLPEINGKKLRIYSPKPYPQLPDIIALRAGMTLAEAARKIGVDQEKFPAMGITEKGIERRQLRTYVLLNRLPEVQLREKEARSPQNIYRAIVGRLGEEEAALKPFEVVDCLKNGRIEPDYKVGIISRYLETEPTLLGQVTIIADLARQIYPKTIFDQAQFSFGMAVRLAKKSAHSLADYIYHLSRAFYPDSLKEQQDFSDMACDCMKSVRVNKEVFFERLAQRYAGDIKQEEIVQRHINLTTFLNSDSRTRIDDYLQSSVETLSHLPPAGQGEAVARAAARLFEDNPILQREMIKMVAARLYGLHRLDSSKIIARTQMIAAAVNKLGLPNKPEEMQ